MMEGKHTIILAQPAKNKATRTYMDYETVSAAMDGKTGMGGDGCFLFGAACAKTCGARVDTHEHVLK